MENYKENTNCSPICPPPVYWIGKVIFGIIFAVIVAVIIGYVVMELWNWLMPSIFDLREITYWESVGMLLLSKILFSGFGHKHESNHHKKESKNSHIKRQSASKFFGNKCEDWAMYNDYWKEEGEKGFKEFVEKKKDSIDNIDVNKEKWNDKNVTVIPIIKLRSLYKLVFFVSYFTMESTI